MYKLNFISTSRADFFIYKKLVQHLAQKKKYQINFTTFDSNEEKNNLHNIAKLNFCFSNIFTHTPILVEKAKKCIHSKIISTLTNSLNEINKDDFDLILCLGDRYEMLTAVYPYIYSNKPIAHFCGGEYTMGSYDQKNRDALTAISDLHFVTNDIFLKRISEIKGKTPYFAYNIGSPSINNLLENAKEYDITNLEEFKKSKFKDFILATFHPDIDSEKQIYNQLSIIEEIVCSNSNLNFLFTKSNEDKHGDSINSKLLELSKKQNCIFINTLGNYYPSALKSSQMVLGNSSSGIVEAELFNTPVLNIGNRQKGRPHSLNVHNVDFNIEKILKKINNILNNQAIKDKNSLYFKKNCYQLAESAIVKFLKLNEK